MRLLFGFYKVCLSSSFFSRSFLCSGLFSGGLFALARTAALFAFLTAALALFTAAFFIAAAGAVQHLLSPSNDLIAVGSDQINSAGDGGNCSQDLSNSSSNFNGYICTIYCNYL